MNSKKEKSISPKEYRYVVDSIDRLIIDVKTTLKNKG